VKADGDSVAAFLMWCAVGAGAGLGVLSILTIGPFVLLVTLTACGFLLWRQNFGWAMAGMISGAGLPLLYVAWSNRHGPGDVCSRTATAISCTDEWSPWPFLAAGVLLVVGGVVLFVVRRGR
jgi:hypothetical protein